jgi:beta-glucanase (GH16 family)
MRPDTSGGGVGRSSASNSVEGRGTSSTSGAFTEERHELERLIKHPEISRSANLVRFLSFICEKYFDGEARDIREQSIAVEALGRKQATFDSHADPIVRVTARTLRKKLRDIYEADGQDYSLQIVLPLGHYVPQFVRAPERRASAPEVAEAVPAPATAITDDGTDGAAQRDSAQPPQTRALNAAWKIAIAGVVVAGIFAAGFLMGRRATEQPSPEADAIHWGDPVWGDEFNGPAHQLPDRTRWNYEVGNPGTMGSRKLVYCTPDAGRPRECDPRRPNAFEDGAGHLILRAEMVPSGMWTSARMTTRGIKNFEYGRIEARMRLPVGAGLWSSFWMLGANLDAVGWPASGSVAIAENVGLHAGSNGLGPSMIRSTLHGPRYFGYNGLWHDYRFPNGARVDDAGFHTYGVIWSPGLMQFYVDDPANVFCVVSPSDMPEGGGWVFDDPFFLVMNLAVGGDWTGDPDATTPNPSEVQVDYVRVYKIPTIPAPDIQIKPMEVTAGSAAASAISLHAKLFAGRVRLACATDSPMVACSLATSVVNFSETLSQVDTLTLSTDTFTDKGRTVASPGHYKVTITATTMSGDRSQLTVPFVVKG